MTAPEIEPLLTRAEVAAIFRVDATVVTRWARSGKLPSVRTPGGRWRFREDVIRALAGQEPQS